MAGEGQILRQAREQRGWSIQETEEITKIRIRYLQALEDENYRILPGVTYVKGFLRTYAKHLGLNPEELVSLYKSSQVEEPTIIQPQPKLTAHASQRKPIWMKPAVLAATGLVAFAIVVGVATFSKQKGDPVATNDLTPPIPSAPQEEIQQPEVKQEAQSPQTPVQDPQSVIAAETEGLTAQLVFTQPCWVVVKVDGQPALEGTFGQGVIKELKAKEQIELVTVGNAGGLSVTLNGKTLPSLGQPSQVVRNVVLNKDSLSQATLQP